MNDKLQFIPLKEISTIHKGLSVKSKIWKNTLRDEKLLIPLPSVEEQIQLSSDYDKVKTVDLNHRYCNPIIEQYDSLMKFFWSYYS